MNNYKLWSHTRAALRRRVVLQVFQLLHAVAARYTWSKPSPTSCIRTIINYRTFKMRLEAILSLYQRHKICCGRNTMHRYVTSEVYEPL
jgi:hypothetical protein